jgi:hypothetical protein
MRTTMRAGDNGNLGPYPHIPATAAARACGFGACIRRPARRGPRPSPGANEMSDDQGQRYRDPADEAARQASPVTDGPAG